VTGATKLKVHIQLVTRNGRVVLDRAVEGNVRLGPHRTSPIKNRLNAESQYSCGFLEV
jgi:hypothetical protein